MINFIKGFIIGIGKIIPGVSGAMLATIMGVYDKSIFYICNFNWETKIKIRRGAFYMRPCRLPLAQSRGRIGNPPLRCKGRCSSSTRELCGCHCVPRASNARPYMRGLLSVLYQSLTLSRKAYSALG